VLPLGRLVLPVVLAVASLSVAAPASADVTGSTSTSDVVLYDHCQQHPISYDLLVSPGTAFWRLEVQVFDPNGRTSEGTVVTSAASPTQGTVYVTFCGSEVPGTYTVRGTGFYEVVPLVHIPFTLPETTFQVRPMATRTRLTERPLGHGRHRLTTRVKQQAEHGYERANGIPVRLEKRRNGSWHRVRGLTLTTVHGKAVAVVTRGGAYRAVVTKRDNHGASTSDVVNVAR
jgi:hypothetical protein